LTLMVGTHPRRFQSAVHTMQKGFNNRDKKKERETERERERKKAFRTNIKKQKSSKKWTKKDLFRLQAAYGVSITTITKRVGE